MAEGKKIKLTYEGLKKLETESMDLKVNRRREVAQKIKEAREQGDLSENAEYDAAKEEQRNIEMRIAEIDRILKNAEIIDEDSFDSESIHFNCTVHLEEMESKKEYTYKLTGSTEANILEGTISDESPLGSKLIGSKVGQVVMVDAPNGDKYSYKILDFKRNQDQ
ncbi:MAG: transcription elongation factor GreA [Eubacterium sp.]|nr:transcription elongation factor GreA [Eubacterium sp.]